MRNARRARVLRSYIRPFYRICVALCPHGVLLPKLSQSSRQDVVIALTEASQPVRDLGSENHLSGLVVLWGRRCVKVLYQFTNGPWTRFLPQWSSWSGFCFP